MEGRLKMKFCITGSVKQIIDESGDYVFEKRTSSTWWFELMCLENLVRILKNTNEKTLSIELVKLEHGDLLYLII